MILKIKRGHTEFRVGDFVLIKLRPHKQLSLEAHMNPMLGARYYGILKVSKRVGVGAYKL